MQLPFAVTWFVRASSGGAKNALFDADVLLTQVALTLIFLKFLTKLYSEPWLWTERQLTHKASSSRRTLLVPRPQNIVRSQNHHGGRTAHLPFRVDFGYLANYGTHCTPNNWLGRQ
jgi:hypothetical protein